MYETHWTGLSRPSWEREMDLQLFRHEILRHGAGTPTVLGAGKLIFSSLATRYCAAGPALRISIAKPIA